MFFVCWVFSFASPNLLWPALYPEDWPLWTGPLTSLLSSFRFGFSKWDQRKEDSDIGYLSFVSTKGLRSHQAVLFTKLPSPVLVIAPLSAPAVLAVVMAVRRCQPWNSVAFLLVSLALTLKIVPLLNPSQLPSEHEYAICFLQGPWLILIGTSYFSSSFCCSTALSVLTKDCLILGCVWISAFCVITGLYKTWGLPKSASGLWLGSEGKKIFPFPHYGVGLPWARIEGNYQRIMGGNGTGSAIRASVASSVK